MKVAMMTIQCIVEDSGDMRGDKWLDKSCKESEIMFQSDLTSSIVARQVRGCDMFARHSKNKVNHN